MRGIIRGVIPVAPTVFLDNEDLDLPGQRRVVDYLEAAESDAVCILANFSEQFSLTDAERQHVIDASVDQADGRMPVVVATSHFSARIAKARCQDAAARGAAMVMLMPPFFGATMSVPEGAVLEYFKRVVGDLDADVMVQDSPLSTTPLSVELLGEIARAIPQVRYAKIEVPRTAAKLRALAASAADLPGLYDGEESVTLIPDLDAGAQGTMCSAVVPDELGRIVRSFHDNQRESAVRAWEAVLPLIHFENRQCGLGAAKYLLAAGGIIRSARTRAPLAELAPTTGEELLELARRRDALVLRWA